MVGLDIAIVGAACRLPGARSLSDLAALLFAGRDAVSEIPSTRWNKDFYYDSDRQQPGKSYTFAAGCLEAIEAFDAGFFGMSPREAMHTDPQQRLLLELAYEAFEDAGWSSTQLSGSDVAVYVGASGWDYATVKVGDIALMDTHSMQGLSLSSLANRISYVFNLAGPSLTVDTACSSALVAVHLGCEAIRSGQAQTAVVGAVNLLISPQNFVGFSRASMLSPTGRCHAFDARADGYVRAEGGGVVLLKPLAQALADGDAIRAVIRGAGVNSDGHTPGFSVPGERAQAELLRRTYAAAGVNPDGLCYLEAHGTGTPVGDPIEAAALGAALGQQRSRPLPIGSIKSNIGHLEAASGMAGLMKLLTILDQREIPPSLHCETPNPQIAFADLNLEVARRRLPLEPGPAGVLLGVNSFGFGGTNAHLILAEPPAPAAQVERSATVPPLVLSAKSEGALVALAQAWSRKLRNAAGDDAALAVRSAARRREQFAHRLVAPADAPAKTANRLKAWVAGSDHELATGRAIGGQVAFVYSGNGSQWAGMGREAYAHNPVFRASVGEIDALFAPKAGWSLAEGLQRPLSDAELEHTEHAQPLLFAIQVAATRALAAHGLTPQAVIGHSVGEVAAAWAAGALSLADAVEVIYHRSRLQQRLHGAGGMAVLNLPAAEAQALIAEAAPGLEIAAINGPHAVTVAGADDELQRLDVAARAARRAFVRLPLAYPFHSRAMAPLEAPLRDCLTRLSPGAPRLTMLSSTTGARVGPGELDADYWWRNIREPVLFAPAVEQLIASGCGIFVEIGPKPALRGHVEALLRTAEVGGAVLSSLTPQSAGADPFAAIAANAHVAGADITGAAAFDGPTDPRALPVYPWQRQPHWLGSTVEAVELIAPLHDHPLLGFRRDDSLRTWRNLLSTERFPWLADHQVDGAAVLPAAAMIDMALAAARARQAEPGAIEVADVEVNRPLLVEGVRELAFEFVAQDRFELTSRPRLSGEPPVVYARGALSTAPEISRFARLAGEPQHILPAAAFYERITGLGIAYGPNFRGVEAARIFSPDEVEVALSDFGEQIGAGWGVDPRHLDAALQSLFATRSLDHTAPGDSIVPWRFGRIRWLRPQSRPITAACRLKRVGPKAHCADFAMLDADGEVVLELLDCWFVRIRPAAGSDAERFFWSAAVACARQPHAAVEPLSANCPPTAEPADSEVLGHAYATAAAYDAVRRLAQGDTLAPVELRRDGRLGPQADRPLEVMLEWLAQDGLALQEGRNWRLTPSDLPEAATIWQTLFFDEPAACAELGLAAANAAALGAVLTGDGDFPDSHLRAQLYESSPSTGAAAEAAVAAVAGPVAAALARWPAGRPARIAVTGRPSSVLLRGLTALTAAPAQHITVFAPEPVMGGVAAELAQHPHCRLERAALPADGQDRFDILVDAFGLSDGLLSPATAAAALAPGGTLIALAPQPNRLWALATGFDRMLSPAAISDQLAKAGATDIATAPVCGAVWRAAMVCARAPALTAAVPLAPPPAAPVWLATPTPSAFAAALAEEIGAELLGLDALAQAWPPSAQVVALAPDPLDTEALAAFCGGLTAATAALAQAGGRLTIIRRAADHDPAAAALAALRRVMTNEGLDARFIHAALDVEPGQLAAELAQPDAEREVRLTPAGRTTRRLRLQLPPALGPARARRLEIARPGLLGSLGWRDFQPQAPGAGEVTIAVEAAGLNFRDVMWALGALPDEALMDGFSGPTLGLECAGRVTAVGPGVTDLRPGDRVAALAPSALASEVLTSAGAVMAVPPSMSFEAAATLPVTAMTVIYALGHLAQLAAGERVLIHGGLGGVGLAAIQYALARGAEVYATAGSDARRAMLRALGVAHVYDSRSPAFADAILQATQGEGVDVVLNSLSGGLMQASLQLLRPFGRFVEIGKRDLFANSQVGLRPLRHNASYFAVDADQLPRLRPALAARVLQEAQALVASGALRPLPYRCFEAADVVDAFRLMQGSGHIGKIIVRPAQGAGPSEAPGDPYRARADRTFVITGGASGFGLETARWLAGQGARHLALISRQGPAAPGLDEALQTLSQAGATAIAYACDVSDPAALAQVLAEVRRRQPPIGGVVHSAMVMDDGLLKDLTGARFAASLRPKLDGAEALDRLTRDDPVEVFVLFSSISAAIGNPGQGNYVVANAAIEAIAERRAAEGLPALAVQWGPIADAGVLTRDPRVRELLQRVLASGDLTARAALGALPRLLASGLPVVGFARADWGVLSRQLPIGETPYLRDLALDERARPDDASIRDQVLALSAAEACGLIEQFLVDEVAAILRLERGAIDVGEPISQMGFDSLMTLELHLAVESRLQCDIAVTAVGGGATLRSIARRVVAALQGDLAGDDADGDDDGLDELLLRHEPLAPAHLARVAAE